MNKLALLLGIVVSLIFFLKKLKKKIIIKNRYILPKILDEATTFLKLNNFLSLVEINCTVICTKSVHTHSFVRLLVLDQSLNFESTEKIILRKQDAKLS